MKMLTDLVGQVGVISAVANHPRDSQLLGRGLHLGRSCGVGICHRILRGGVTNLVSGEHKNYKRGHSNATENLTLGSSADNEIIDTESTTKPVLAIKVFTGMSHQLRGVYFEDA